MEINAQARAKFGFPCRPDFDHGYRRTWSYCLGERATAIKGKAITFPCIGTLFRDDDGFI
jgi:hypothetical protein